MNQSADLTPLYFSIIGSSPNFISVIKQAFSDVEDLLLLKETYTSPEQFMKAGPSHVDFIAMNGESFTLAEEKMIRLDSPVILFSDSLPAGSHNYVFALIEDPADQTYLKKILKNFRGIKMQFYTRGLTGNNNNWKKSTSRTFIIKKGKEFHLLNSDNIPAFYTDKTITFAYDKTGKKFMVHLSLIELENILSSDIFFRANRQYLINRNYISLIKQSDVLKFEIILQMGELLRIEITHQKFSRLKNWIENDMSSSLNHDISSPTETA